MTTCKNRYFYLHFTEGETKHRVTLLRSELGFELQESDSKMHTFDYKTLLPLCTSKFKPILGSTKSASEL